jgi:hypothetical protein
MTKMLPEQKVILAEWGGVGQLWKESERAIPGPVSVTDLWEACHPLPDLFDRRAGSQFDDK